MRALVAGAVLTAILSAAIPWTDTYLQGSEMGGCHFPVGPIFFFLLFVLLVNPIANSIHRSAALRPGELVLVFSMMLVASGLATYGFSVHVIVLLAAPALAAPRVDYLVPNYGPVTGGTPVVVVGEGFESGATVAIGGVDTTDVVVVDGHTLTATTADAGTPLVAEVVQPIGRELEAVGGGHMDVPAEAGALRAGVVDTLVRGDCGGRLLPACDVGEGHLDPLEVLQAPLVPSPGAGLQLRKRHVSITEHLYQRD